MQRCIVRCAGHGARPTTFTEAEVEEAALKWLQGLRWNVAHGTDIPSDPPNAERNDYGQAVPERVYEALTSPHRISRRLSARLLPACPACLLQTGGRRQATPPRGGSDWNVKPGRACLAGMDGSIAGLFPDRLAPV